MTNPLYKRLTFGLLIALGVGYVSANTTIGIANISVPIDRTQLPNFLIESGIVNYDSIAESQFGQRMSVVSVKVAKSIAVKYPNIHVTGVESGLASEFIAHYNVLAAESREALDSDIDVSDVESGVPDYIMIGELTAINAGDQKLPIESSTKYSDVYNINAAVSYRIIRMSDQKVVGGFTAAGQAGSVQFLSDENAIPNYNTTELIQSASDSLLVSILSQFDAQVTSGKLEIQMVSSAK